VKTRHYVFPKQRDFLQCTARHPAYMGGNGAGKTYVSCLKGFDHATRINPGLRGMLVAPSYPELKDYTIPTFIDILFDIQEQSEQAEYVYQFTYNKNDKEVYLPYFSTLVMFRSADNPLALRGRTLAWYGLEEADDVKQEAWGELAPRLRQAGANLLQGWISGTPRGYGWVYIKWVDKPPSKEYVLFQVPTRANIFVQEDYEQIIIEAAADEDEILARTEGAFVESSRGRAYRRFNRDIHVTDRSPFGTEIPFPGLTECLCCDFNVDPCCWILLQHKNGLIYVYDEIVQNDTDTTQMSVEARSRIHGNCIVYGDAAGGARSTAGQSDYAIMQTFGFRRQNIPASNPPVKDSVSSVNKLLIGKKISNEPEKPIPQLYIHPRCEMLIRDLERVRWKEGASGILDKSDRNLTHASDALRYFTSRVYGVEIKPPPPKRIAMIGR
jgi:hypothetical protein